MVLEPLEHRIAVLEAVHVAGRELGAEGIVGGEGVPVGQGEEEGPDALDITLRIDRPRGAREHRRRGGGLVAADRAAHGVGGDQAGQGQKVVFRQTPQCMVSVEMEEEGPDGLHVEGCELAERRSQIGIGLLAERDGAVMIGPSAEIARQRLGAGIPDPARAGVVLERGVFLPLPGHLAGPHRQVMAEEGIEVFLPVALEAAFDGPQMVGVQSLLALAVERHEDEVADHVGAAEIAAAGVHGLEDAMRVVLALLEVEGDDAELAQARAQGRHVGAEPGDALLEEGEGLEDAGRGARRHGPVVGDRQQGLGVLPA